MRSVHSLALGLGFYHGGIEGLTGGNGDPLSVELKLDKVFHMVVLLVFVVARYSRAPGLRYAVISSSKFTCEALIDAHATHRL